MKNLFHLLLVFSASVAFGEGFEKVISVNAVDVWAVGSGGNVFRSFDGGATWGSYPLGSANLKNVFAIGSNIWIVGDGGSYYRSTNNGESFSAQTLAGGATLRALWFTNSNQGFIAGDGGILLRTTDGGASWSALAGPTPNAIYDVRFTNDQTGYLVGASGTVMKTVNSGSSWSSLNPGIAGTLYAVAIFGGQLIVAGADASCARSNDGGASWSLVNFKFDTKSDVNDVAFGATGEVFFCGGGGFIRKSTDGATTFSYPMHPMLAELSDLYFSDALKGWACNRKNNAILRTTDGGVTWSLPTGTTVAYAWTQKLSVTASVRGDAISLNPFNKNSLFIALGTRVYVSYNRGETWTNIRGLPTGGSKVNSFYVSPKDSNMWVAAYGSPDRIVRSTDYGLTWTATITKDFSEYGMPLEMDGSHPDTLYFGPEDGTLYCSTNFGATWDSISHPGFRSPCDIVVVRDDPNTLWVGDGVTGSGFGQVFRSSNGGKSFSLVFTTTGSEIPTISSSAIDNTVGYATAWSAGGVRKTNDNGASWNSVATTGSAWGTDIAKDDPNVVMYGVYSGSLSYLSTNGGVSFSTASLSGANYALYCYDRSTFLAQQSGGVYKLGITYTVPTNNTQVLNLLSPDGGQTWTGGSQYPISWSVWNISNVRLEYRTSPSDPWQLIQANVAATQGNYTWTCPYVTTTQARIRVSDATDTNPQDVSTTDFSILSSMIAATPGSLDFGEVILNSSRLDTIRLYNNGAATLVVSSVLITGSSFVPGRTSFTIPPGSSDTLTVRFAPGSVAAYFDTLRISNNSANGVLQVPLSGVCTNTPVPIQLSSFSGRIAGSNVHLEWTTLSELNNYGFYVQRRRLNDSTYTDVPGSFIPGHGTTLTRHSYSFDFTSDGSAYYRLRQVDLDGSQWFSEGILLSTLTVVDEPQIPNRHRLAQNFPNPFNPSTTIAFELPRAEHVTLEVFDALGTRVAMLLNEQCPVGGYSVQFNPSSLASGVYFYRLATPSFKDVKQMILVK